MHIAIFVQDSTSKAISFCSRVGKPSTSQAEALRNLFPSSSASTSAEYITARKRAFDPTADCVFSGEKKKRKQLEVEGLP